MNYIYAAFWVALGMLIATAVALVIEVTLDNGPTLCPTPVEIRFYNDAGPGTFVCLKNRQELENFVNG